MDFFEILKTEGKKDDTEIVQQAPQEYRMIGYIRKRPGHTLFSFNLRTGEVKPAEMESRMSINQDGKTVKENRIKIEPRCIYRQALNRKSFLHKLEKEGFIRLIKRKKKHITPPPQGEQGAQ